MTTKKAKRAEGDVFAKKYEAALRRFLSKGANAAALEPATRLGQQAVAAGLETLEFALIHELALVKQALPASTARVRNAVVKKAGKFFAKAVLPMEDTHRAAREVNAHSKALNEALSSHTQELLVTNRKLSNEVGRRKAVEQILRGSRKTTTELLAEARRTQKHLQLFSRRILTAQEEERKRISRELHDVIAQMLTVINLRLAELRKNTTTNASDLSEKIAKTQRLVEESVVNVHQFARQLRPAMLDDLGLIPAIKTLLAEFTRNTEIAVVLKSMGEVEELNVGQRTVFYRVAQEALSNVCRHAKATRVRLTLSRQAENVHMSIKDNGKSFDVKKVIGSGRALHLGILGMKERIEMLGGTFEVRSAKDKGTDVRVALPLHHTSKKRGK